MARKITKDQQPVFDHQMETLRDSIQAQLDDGKMRAQVYVLVRHVSQSGMRRIIDLQTVDMTPDSPWRGEVRPLSLVGQLDYRYDYPHNGYVVDGCGMDMGFALLCSVMHRLHVWMTENCPEHPLTDRIKDSNGWQDVVRHAFL